MKNYLLLTGLCLMAGLANAQQKMSMESMFPKSAKYYIKGESTELQYNKIDSVLKSWGGRFMKKSVTEDNVEKVYLEKFSEEMLKRQQENREKAPSLVGKAAPLFELTDINNKKYSLNDLKGKVVVLNFWFTACVPCKEEMPELNKLKEKYKGKDVVFLAIGLDKADTIKDFLKTNAFNYTLLTDGKKTADAYSVSAFPTSMVIDRTGVMSFTQLGGANIEESLSKEINKLL